MLRWLFLAALGGAIISGPGSGPPVLSSISSGTPGSTTATITWTSDVLSTSQVCYSQATDVAHETCSALNATPVTSHSVSLIGLTSSQLYHYVAESVSSAGVLAISADQTFTTGAGSSPVVTITGTNIAFSPTSPQTVTSGATLHFTSVTANTGYVLLRDYVTGTCPLGGWSGNSYTTGAITASCTIVFNNFNPASPSAVGYNETFQCDACFSPSTVDMNATNNSGYKWYLTRPFGYGTFPTADLSFSAGVLTLNAPSNAPSVQYGPSTAGHTSAPGHVGNIFGGGWYMTASLSFNNANVNTSGGWPAIWAFPTQQTDNPGVTDVWAGYGTVCPGSTNPGYEHYLEDDMFEYDTSYDGVSTFGMTLHDWYGGNCSAAGTSQYYAGPGGNVAVVAYLPTTTWTSFNTLGQLWIAATAFNGYQGFEYLFWNGVLIPPNNGSSPVYFANWIGNQLPNTPPPAPTWALSLIDQETYQIIMDTGCNGGSGGSCTGASVPMQVQSVDVWQLGGTVPYQGEGDVAGSAAWGYWGVYAYGLVYASANSKMINLCTPADASCADINSTTAGVLNAAQIATLGTCNNTSSICLVETLYDQSGNTNCTTACNFTQATAALQAQLGVPGASDPCPGGVGYCIVCNGSCVYDATTSVALAQPFTTTAVAERASNAGYVGLFAERTNVYYMGWANVANTLNIYNGGAGATNTTLTDGNWGAIQGTWNGASSTMTVNGVAGTAAGATGGIGSADVISLGSAGATPASFLNGSFTEMAVYPAALSGTPLANVCKVQQAHAGASGFPVQC